MIEFVTTRCSAIQRLCTPPWWYNSWYLDDRVREIQMIELVMTFDGYSWYMCHTQNWQCFPDSYVYVYIEILSLSHSLSLSLFPSPCLSLSPPHSPSVYLSSICLSVYLSVCLALSRSLYLSFFLHSFCLSLSPFLPLSAHTCTWNAAQRIVCYKGTKGKEMGREVTLQHTQHTVYCSVLLGDQGYWEEKRCDTRSIIHVISSICFWIQGRTPIMDKRLVPVL